MKNLLVITLISIVFLNCREANRTVNRFNNQEQHYGISKQLDSLNLQREYDKARWWLYCFHCDEKCKFWPETGIRNTNITLGELELRLDNFKISRDTLLMFLGFYFHDTIRYDSKTGRFGNLTGVKMTLNNDSIISFYDDGNIKDYWDGPNSRFGNPLQPEVIKYIRQNKDKIDPWFYQEAKKRGVFDSTKFPKI